MYSKSAAQLYAAQLAASGLPKANSVHDLDMGQPQPAPVKRTAKAAARRNPPSAPGPYAQGWSQMPVQPAYPGAMPGLLHFTIVANMSLQHVCLVSMLP